MRAARKRLAVHLTALGCLACAACSPSAPPSEPYVPSVRPQTTEKTWPGGSKETTVDHSWNPGSQAIAEKNWDGSWEFREVVAGESIVVCLLEYHRALGTFDGMACRKIIFQLPAGVQPGDFVKLKEIPGTRPTRKGSYDNDLAGMRDGELTAVEFSNPDLGFMQRAKHASVRILSIGPTAAVIHLRLAADLEYGGYKGDALDINEPFTVPLNRAPHPQGLPHARPRTGSVFAPRR